MNAESAVFAFFADLALVLHGTFVLFVVGGQVLILFAWWRRWQWARHPIFRYSHMAGIGLVVLQSWFRIPCPLTVMENSLRIAASEAPYQTSFIDHWISRLLFYSAPAWVFVLIYTVFGALVLFTFFRFPPRGRRNKRN